MKWCVSNALAVALLVTCGSVLSETPPRPNDDHVREELGVNAYTTPPIDRLFTQLDELAPIPFDEVKRDIPTENYPNRFQLALNFGALIADGFLIVHARQRQWLDDLGRALIKQARALGVGEQVTRHGRSLTERGQRGDWKKLRTELAATQSDVEKAMLELRDEQIAHMISLGGWLRGLEITSEAVVELYTPERAAKLKQLDLVDYFDDRMEHLHPVLKKKKLMEKISAGLKTIRSLLEKRADGNLDPADVKLLHDTVKSINQEIAEKGKE